MKKIYKRILSLGLAVGVIFSLQESVHICAQENTQTTESFLQISVMRTVEKRILRSR